MPMEGENRTNWFDPPPPSAQSTAGVSGKFGTGFTGGGGSGTYNSSSQPSMPSGYNSPFKIIQANPWEPVRISSDPLLSNYERGNAGVSAGTPFMPTQTPTPSPWFGGTMLASSFPAAVAAGGGPWFDRPRAPEMRAKQAVGPDMNEQLRSKSSLQNVSGTTKYDKDGMPVTAKGDENKWNSPKQINPQHPYVPQNVDSSIRDSVALRAYQMGLMAQGDNSDMPRFFSPGNALPVAQRLAEMGVTITDAETGEERPITEQDLITYQQNYYEPQSPWHLIPGTMLTETRQPQTTGYPYPKSWSGYGGGGGYSSGGSNWQDYLMNLTTWRGL